MTGLLYNKIIIITEANQIFSPYDQEIFKNRIPAGHDPSNPFCIFGRDQYSPGR